MADGPFDPRSGRIVGFPSGLSVEMREPVTGLVPHEARQSGQRTKTPSALDIDQKVTITPTLAIRGARIPNT